MPTYEYECPYCRRRFEKVESITAKPITPCPRCHNKAKRLISKGGGLLFKGSGFYITDHRSLDYKAKAKAEGSSEVKSKEKK